MDLFNANPRKSGRREFLRCGYYLDAKAFHSAQTCARFVQKKIFFFIFKNIKTRKLYKRGFRKLVNHLIKPDDIGTQIFNLSLKFSSSAKVSHLKREFVEIGKRKFNGFVLSPILGIFSLRIKNLQLVEG